MNTDHPGWGYCKFHGGNTPAGRKFAERLMAEHEVKNLGLPREVDPHAALLEELYRTAGHVAWLGAAVQALDEQKLVGKVGSEGPTQTGAIMHPRYEPSVWIRMYQEERAHLTRVAEACIKAGIEERRVRVAEDVAEQLAPALKSMMEALKLTAEQKRAAPGLLRETLEQLQLAGRNGYG